MRKSSLHCAMLSLIVAVAAIVPQQRTWAQQENASGVAGGQMVRGTVTATAADHLAIRTDKGDAYQITITDNTRIREGRQPVKISDVKPGDSVGAMGVLDAPNHTVHAAVVMVVDAAQAQKMRDEMGKVYIAGKVTAIDDLKLTIQRPDGVVQVIAVDEGTSFRRGGRRIQAMIDGSGPAEETASQRNRRPPADSSDESITLADIKVGNTVAGRGELKGGIFVPSELAVTDGTQRQRRQRPEGMGRRTGSGTVPPAGESTPQ
jgi:hypothetical protein